MPWTVGTFHKKRWYHSPWPWIGAAFVLSIVFLVLPHAQDFYRGWVETRRLGHASESFARGDFKDAILRARMVLQRNSHSIEATRIFARSLEALDSGDALAARQHLESIGGGDAENSLRIAAAMWKASNSAGAARTLAEMPPESRTSAEFHELSAGVAARNNDYAAAAQHWKEASHLAPANPTYALERCGAELKLRDETVRTTARAELTRLSADPNTRLVALRMLLSDATASGENSRSATIAAELAATPGATFVDKLRRLTGLHSRRLGEARDYLARLQKEAASEPRNVFLLLTWMNENGLALAIPEWRDQLPAQSTDLPQVRSALAEAEARASNWTRLRETLAQESWQDLEFLRHAYLTRAAERLGDELGTTAAWNNALAAAGNHPWPLEVLARTILGWGWTQRADVVLMKLLETGNAPRWAADHVWQSALAAQNTTQLYQAARALATLDPRSVAARNNYIALALLIGQDADSPHKLAATLFQLAPNDPVVASTYGLSLFQQGRAAEAVTVMKTFPHDKLREPNIALYYTIFLTGAGRLAESQEARQDAASAPMLPEERALFIQAGGEPATALVR